MLSALKRFDGSRQTAFTGDVQRRDQDLWSDGLGCLTYLHSRNISHREPTFKIPIDALRRSNSPYLLKYCLYRPTASATSMKYAASELKVSTGSCGDQACNNGRACADLRLFVPPPVHASRDECHAYNLTTRNYFAFLMARPLVGTQLSTTLTDLWRRIQLWSPNASSELYEYCRAQGYTDVTGNPRLAVAMLALATEARWQAVWVDAFAHCVGMQSQLSPGCALDGLDSALHRLVMDAAQVLTSQVSHSTQALSTFLEDELNGDKVGLSKPARDHLERFRGNLHAHYVEKIGYYPPGPHETCDRRLWLSMHDDFRSLYDFLVDKRSSSEQSSALVLNGGICIEQNLQAFDTRNDYSPLPHSLPLLPGAPEGTRSGESTKITRRRSFRFSRNDSMLEQHAVTRKALADAANIDAPHVSNSLVQEYVRFEQLPLAEKLPAVEARKVRWLLIYGMLQALIRITKAPAGVQDISSPLYPLCISLASLPDWVTADVARGPSPIATETGPQSAPSSDAAMMPDSDQISIHPDCEADNAEDFFARSSRSRFTTDHEAMNSPALKRNGSLHSSFTSLHRSVVGSLSRRSSLRVLGSEHGLRRKSSFRTDLVAADENSSGNEWSAVSSGASSPQHGPSKAASLLSSPAPAVVPAMRPLVETLVDGINDEDDDNVAIQEPTLEDTQVFTSNMVPPLPQDLEGLTEVDEPEVFITTIAGVRSGSHPIPTLVDISPPQRGRFTSINDSPIRQHDSRQRKENHRRLSGFDFGFVGCIPAGRPPTSIPEEGDHQYYYDEDDRDEDGDASPISSASPDAHEATLRCLVGMDPAPVCLNAGTYIPTGANASPSSPSSPVFYTHESEYALAHGGPRILATPITTAVDIVERRKSRALPRLLNMARVRARFSMGA